MNPFAILGVLRSIVTGIPLWVWPVAFLVSWGWYGHHKARVKAQEVVAATKRAESAEVTAEQERKHRADERRIAQHREVVAESDAKQQARDRAATAAVTQRVDGLLARVDALVAASRANPSASAVAGSSPADRLGDTLKSCFDQYRQLGDVARDAVRRGLRCEGEYRAVEETLNKPEERKP